MTELGSSSLMEDALEFSGILSHDPLQNPDFSTGTRLKCDIVMDHYLQVIPIMSLKMEQHFSSEASLSGTHLWMSSCPSECLKLKRMLC